MTISPREEAEGVFVSPADRLVSELDGTYYKLTEAAKILNVAPITLRRLMRKHGIKAPSYQVNQGEMKVYLYTPDDLEELSEYFIAQRTPTERTTE